MIETHCPICDKPVTKIKETDHEIKNHVICQNEFYIHYVDTKGANVLIKHPEAHVNAPEKRFAI